MYLQSKTVVEVKVKVFCATTRVDKLNINIDTPFGASLLTITEKYTVLI